jgi:hypothetical protein
MRFPAAACAVLLMGMVCYTPSSSSAAEQQHRRPRQLQAAPSPAAAGVPTSDCYHVPDFARKYSCALPAYDWQSCAQRLQRQGQDATFLTGYYFSQQHCTCLPAKYVDPACGGEAGNAAAPKFSTLAQCQARCHVAAGCPSVCSAAVCFD